MECEIKPFDEATMDDAKNVAEAMFSNRVFSVLEKMLTNPLRRELGVSAAGEIVYQDGKPVAFQGAIVRRLYLGKEPFVGVVGSTLCARPETSPVLLAKLMRTTIRPRGSGALYFANTAIPASSRMNRLLGVKGKTPESCAGVDFAVFKWGEFLNFALKGRLLRFVSVVLDFIGKLGDTFWMKRRRTDMNGRLETDIGEAFSDFWKSYLEGNVGVVASRTQGELRWMFEDALAGGKIVVISLRDAEDMIHGYIAAKVLGSNRKRWMIVDWIALRDDESVLSDLLYCLIDHLKKIEGVAWLESVGFPMSIRMTLKRFLPFRRKLRESVFVYKAFDKKVEDALADPSARNWFWGGYDGDRCM